MPEETFHAQYPNLRDRRRDLRANATEAEKLLWQALRSRLSGRKFRRQHQIGSYIVEFYCSHAGLVIELDGTHHLEPEAIADDAARTAYLEGRGLQVMRFTNLEVAESLDAVIARIAAAVVSV